MIFIALLLRFAGCCSNFKTKAPKTTGSNHSRAPDDGHNGARNMFSKQ